MFKRFTEFCRTEKIFDGIKGAVVAVSGGADSLALADMLARARRMFGIEICIAHYEHGLRGQDSLDDEKFVEEFSENLGIRFFSESGDVKKFSAENKISTETAARVLRYEFLAKVRRSLNFDAIILAHHADDFAETILMRILRGTGTSGLDAMKFKTFSKDYGLLIRPLLKFRKFELERYCESRNLIPRIDATNFETDATRNKIRLKLLPELEKNFNPAIVETLCRLGETSAAEKDFINSEVEKIFPEITVKNFKTGRLEILQSEFLKLHPALQRVAIRKFVEEVTGSAKDFGFVHFEEIRKVLANNLTGTELPKKLRANLKQGKLTIIENKVFEFNSAE